MPHQGFDPYRRGLLKGVLAAATTAPFVSALQACAGHRARASSPYGPLRPVNDLSTGLPLLQLPDGFYYKSLSWAGDAMSNGQPVPVRHDGMAVIAHRQTPVGTELVLVRNHEIGHGPRIGAIGVYDALDGSSSAGGGTTNIYFPLDLTQEVRTAPSLGGTLLNCAGGPTPWGTWLSCEETTQDLTAVGGRRHGYVFEVTADPAQTSGEPIIAMGRFRHEAAAVDPSTGIVYMTEDARNVAGLYRYLPLDPSGRPGALARGGKLQAAKVKGVDNADLLAPALGDVVELEWVDIDDPDAGPGPFRGSHATGEASGPFLQAWAAGALRMARGEGIWYGDGRMYIVDTSAGSNLAGQPGYGEGCVWMLDLTSMRMETIFASNTPSVGNNPDNITVSPRGGVLACEDGGGTMDEYGFGNRLLGLTTSGESYLFAKNNVVLSDADVRRIGKKVAANDYRGSEFCGACFDPTGQFLFVNAQAPGITFAIWGPWGRGPL
jgi:secreted PhoX family phosphatase